MLNPEASPVIFSHKTIREGRSAFLGVSRRGLGALGGKNHVVPPSSAMRID